MTPKFIAFCIFLFVTSALISLSFRDNGAHLRTWLPKTPRPKQVTAVKEKPAGPKIAYATFLSATTASDDPDLPDEADGYFLGTRVMLYQLLHSKIAGNSSIPVIVMVTDKISARKRARLEKDGATVIQVERLQNNWMHAAHPRWADLLTKLRLFELTDYHKICYMDSDILITDTLDGVFFDEATLTQQTLNNPAETKEDEGKMPRTYMLAAHSDTYGYDHPYPPDPNKDYLNCGFLVFQPSKALFNYYMAVSGIEGRFDSGMMEQNLLNYAHRWAGNMPWRPLWPGWNVNWPTERDYQGGARSFHAKYWDPDPSHDPFLKGLWYQQRAEMEGYWRGREGRQVQQISTA